MAGLDLSSKGNGSLTLGADQAVNPSQVNPISAPLPNDVIDFENNPLQSGLLAKLGSPEASALFESIADSPERSEVVLSGLMDKSPTMQALIKQDPSGASATKFMATPEGAKEMDRMTDQHIKPIAMKKISSLTTSLDKLSRDGNINKTLLDRVMSDGKISIPEIQELNESIPEGHELKLTPGEIGAVSAERNLPGLRAVGISLSEDFKPEEVSGSGKTVVDANGDVVGTLVTSKTGGNQVQPPGGGAARPFSEGEFVTTIGDSSEGVNLTKKSRGNLEKSSVETRAILDNLSSELSRFDKDFLTFGGQVKFEALRVAEKLGTELSQENKDFQSKFAQFKSITTTTLSEELHRLSGAAASDQEVKNRLLPAMPNADDSPSEYLAKVGVVRERLQVVSLRAEMALAKGIKAATDIPWQTVVNQIEDGSLPNERMNALIEQGLSEQEAFAKVESEFPASMLDKAMGNN